MGFSAQPDLFGEAEPALPLLQLNLDEEGATDKKLTKLAQSVANQKGQKAA
jgi:ferritin-like metal-binding protein YciE